MTVKYVGEIEAENDADANELAYQIVSDNVGSLYIEVVEEKEESK